MKTFNKSQLEKNYYKFKKRKRDDEIVARNQIFLKIR